MIVPANSEDAKRTCTTCAKNKVQRFCAAYIDEVSGELAAIREARAICKGTSWERAFWHTDKEPETYTPLWASEDKTYRKNTD